MDELLEQFILEGRDLVADAHSVLVALSRDPQNKTALDSLFRSVHTLKGSVALFEMAPAEEMLHAAETRLEAARRRDALLDERALDAVLAVIDQTDRWIDAMEMSGSLSEGAGAQADRLITMLLADDGAGGTEADGRPHPLPATVKEEADWLVALRSRQEFSAVDIQQAQTAFRYTPDADCFFRGEDPLAISAAVPDLLALAVLPVAGEWPAIASCEPFRCISVIEGISGGDEASVRAAFRLMPDQVAVATLGSVPEAQFADVDPQPKDASSMLRVEASRLDRLASQVGELTVAIRTLRPIADRLRALDPLLAAELSAADDEIGRVAGEVQRSVARVRQVSLEPVLRRLPRLAREAAANLGKTVRFILEGETARVDKEMADQLFEPLLHIVRNAVDHGVEPASDRAANGKPPEGKIQLSVRPEGNGIKIMIADDGRGIDAQALRETAIAKRLMNSDAAAALSDAEALRIIFLPGFSTAEKATSLSGRGVGMDAVKAAVERLAGTITVDSEPGQGTRIILRLPANALTTSLVVVGAGGQQLGIRLDQIVETARISASAIHPVGQKAQACVLREETVPLLDLASLLGLEPASGGIARLLITDIGPCRTALRVDSLEERFDGVVRQADGLLTALPAIAGTAMMADGRILLVLDLPELVA